MSKSAGIWDTILKVVIAVASAVRGKCDDGVGGEMS